MLTKTREEGRTVSVVRLNKILSREFWYTNVCVGSNPTPVTKHFRRDEAESSADIFRHIKTRVGLNANPFRQTF